MTTETPSKPNRFTGAITQSVDGLGKGNLDVSSSNGGLVALFVFWFLPEGWHALAWFAGPPLLLAAFNWNGGQKPAPWRDPHLGFDQATGKSSSPGRPVTWRQ